jgi:hypothetical protein
MSPTALFKVDESLSLTTTMSGGCVCVGVVVVVAVLPVFCGLTPVLCGLTIMRCITAPKREGGAPGLSWTAARAGVAGGAGLCGGAGGVFFKALRGAAGAAAFRCKTCGAACGR